MVHDDRGPEKLYLEGAEDTPDQSGRSTHLETNAPGPTK